MEVDASDGNYSTGLCIGSVVIKSPCVNHLSNVYVSLNALVHIASRGGDQTDPQLAQLLIPEQPTYLTQSFQLTSPQPVSVSFSSLCIRHWSLLDKLQHFSGWSGQDGGAHFTWVTGPEWLMGSALCPLRVLPASLLTPVDCHWQQLLKLHIQEESRVGGMGQIRMSLWIATGFLSLTRRPGALWGCLIRKFCLSDSSCRPSHISQTTGKQVPSKI